ncbi:hypothetical protein ACIP5U_39175 [Streptomyces sp. NPDC088788]|uniref:hypothetical protein n=1 Tax=Streptomyces sp. NPDC088788 TaxID=3365898 RepID=UPI003803107D
MSEVPFHANPARTRALAIELLELHGKLQRLCEDAVRHLHNYDRFLGDEDAKYDSFFKQASETQKAYVRKMLEASGAGEALGVVAGQAVKYGISVQGAESYAGDLLDDAKRLSEKALNDIASTADTESDGMSDGEGRH